MLIELRVGNHRSLRDEQALTMGAAPGGDADDPRPRSVAGYKQPLLPVAALYGANASGKSNVLAALAFMHHAVLYSHRTWSPDGGVSRDPFAWGEGVTRPSLFEITLVLEGVRYRYGFLADDERFVEEWLYAWPAARKQTWFERDEQRFKFGEHLRGENRVVEQVTRPNALFLSAAAQHQHPQLEPLHAWFRRFSVHPAEFGPFRSWPDLIGSAKAYKRVVREQARASGRSFDGVGVDAKGLGATSDASRASLLGLLEAADVGIVDLKFERPDGGGPPRIMLKHRSKEDSDAWLELARESRGTISLFNLGPHVLGSLRSGSVLLVDELEGSLHPLLALEVVSLFNNPRTNPHGAQLLFTTQNTHLLGRSGGPPALRRDQVWLTEKDEDGATCVYPLTDYKPRKEENVERGYLQGRYGAIPFLGELLPERE